MEWIPDGHIQGRGKPDSSFKTEHGSIVSINALGFRGPMPTLLPQQGICRIIVLGGSAAFSYHARGEERTWAKVLEQKLQRAEGPRVEVVNLALPGFNTRTQLINYLILARRLKPHAVVVYETWNDLKALRELESDPFFGSTATVADHNKPLWQVLARHSQIALRVRNLLLTMQRRKRENVYTSLEKVGQRAHTPIMQIALDSFWQSRRDFISLLTEDGVRPIFVSQANLAHGETIQDASMRERIDNDLVGMTLPVLVATLEGLSQEGRQLCSLGGCLFIDAYGSMPPTLENFEDHVHLTDKGEDVLGTLIAQQAADDIHRACQD